MIRRSGEREPAAFGRLDPLQTVRNLMNWDPFRDLMRWESLGGLPGLERGRGVSYMPDMEVRETADAFFIDADVPGVQEKDIDVSIAGNVLSVSGKREEETREESGQLHAYERSYGSFCRSFTLPEGCDAEKVSADLKNGVLKICVPKKASVHARHIPIGEKKQEQALEGKHEGKKAA